MVLPLMEYRDFLVDTAKRDTINKVDKILERALKVIDNQYGNPFRPTIRTLMPDP